MIAEHDHFVLLESLHVMTFAEDRVHSVCSCCVISWMIDGDCHVIDEGRHVIDVDCHVIDVDCHVICVGCHVILEDGHVI